MSRERDDSAVSTDSDRASPLQETGSWPHHQPSIAARVATSVAESALNVFFSTVEVANEENIPPDGPVILFGNHSNQFVDGMVMNHVAERQVSFVMAEVSFHKPVIGHLAKAMDAVPVVRPQDRKFWAKGSIDSLDIHSLTLKGTGFKTALSEGCLVKVAGTQLLITEVISDTESKIKKPLPEALDMLKQDIVVRERFQVTPKVSQDEMFESVYSHLSEGKCIGIFPEGGSHDRTELLPLKAGVVMMALGALERGIPVTIVPVGINYFAGHHFRSKVFVDVGKPIVIEKSLVNMYANKETRRGAINTLLETMTRALSFCVITAPDFATLKVIRTARRMYQSKIKLTTKEYIDLNLRFSQAFKLWSNDERYQSLMSDIADYLEFARSQGLTDKQVRDLPPLDSMQTVLNAAGSILTTMLMVLVALPLVLPGVLLYLPIPLYTRHVIPREMAKAMAGSNVKVAARDVVASQKIMIAIKLIPLIHVVYSVFWAAMLWFMWGYLTSPEWGFIGYYFVYNSWWILPITFNLVGPYYLFQMVPSTIENVARRIRLFPKHLLCVLSFFNSSKRHPAELLRSERRKMTVRIQDLVENLISTFPEWENERIINRAKLVKRRSYATKTLASTGDLQSLIPSSK